MQSGAGKVEGREEALKALGRNEGKARELNKSVW